MKDFQQRARCDRTFTVDVYCRSYVIEVRGFGRVSEEEKRESKALLDFLMGMFESNINSQVRETILDVCTYYDDVFPYPRHRETDMSVFAIQGYVEDCLGRWVWSGEITIRRDDDRWWGTPVAHRGDRAAEPQAAARSSTEARACAAGGQDLVLGAVRGRERTVARRPFGDDEGRGNVARAHHGQGWCGGASSADGHEREGVGGGHWSGGEDAG